MKKNNKKFFYLTTPIFYPNNKLHLGHAYTMILADSIVRFKKTLGYSVYFQSGSDEHGEKIIKTSYSLNQDVNEMLEKNILKFKELFSKLNISEHFFFRTSDQNHIKKVINCFKFLLNKNEIYKGEFIGDYCLNCESLQKNNEEKTINCIDCNKPTQKIKEKSFFLKVAKHREWLKKIYKKNLIIPSHIGKELINNFLDNELTDLCITREKDVGIKIEEEKLSIYVWFDALLNYINSEQGDYLFKQKKEQKSNIEILHIIGKDISRFHCIYWPIILKNLNLSLPDHILVHGWILNENKNKISKSSNNFLDPLVLLNKYPSDLLRAFFLSKINIFQDGIINEELLLEFYKSFFINDLGNLINRVSKMIFLYNKGILSNINLNLIKQNDTLKKYINLQNNIKKQIKKEMNAFQLTNSFKNLEKLIKSSNQLINEFSPWNITENKLIKTFLSCLIRGIKLISFVLSFFTPETSEKISKIFEFDISKVNWNNCFNLNFLNKQITKKDSILFKTIKF